MTVDTSQVGITAAELMERLAEIAPEDSEVGVVMLVVEVLTPPSEEHPDGGVAITSRCSDGRHWVQRALLNEALDEFDETDHRNGPDA